MGILLYVCSVEVEMTSEFSTRDSGDAFVFCLVFGTMVLLGTLGDSSKNTMG